MNEEHFYPPTSPPNSAFCLLIDVFKLMASIPLSKDKTNALNPKIDLFSTFLVVVIVEVVASKGLALQITVMATKRTTSTVHVALFMLAGK